MLSADHHHRRTVLGVVTAVVGIANAAGHRGIRGAPRADHVGDAKVAVPDVEEVHHADARLHRFGPADLNFRRYPERMRATVAEYQWRTGPERYAIGHADLHERQQNFIDAHVAGASSERGTLPSGFTITRSAGDYA